MNIQTIQEKLNRCQVLLKNKQELTTTLSEIDKELNTLLSQVQTKAVGSNSKEKRSLAHSLDYYIIKVMCPGAHMTPIEVSIKVQEEGYHTDNKDFASYMGSILANREDVMKVRHGVYTRVVELKDALTLGS